MRLFCVLFLLVRLAAAATLAERVQKILSLPAARRAFWGIKVVDVESGSVVYQLNADRPFVPASNTKLFTTALALTRLGPDYRHLTRLATDSPPDSAGRIAGDLVLVGGGDPNLSSRVLPYEKRAEFLPQRLAFLEDLADQVAALGIRKIDGDIVGDDTYYVWERYASGWALEDTFNEDGPPVTALAINDNVVTLRIRPGGRAELDPPLPYYELDNRIRTGAAQSEIHVHREPGERIVRVWGEMASTDKGRSVFLAIDDPALYAAEALRQALIRRSISVLGRAISRHTMPYDPAQVDKSYALVVASRSSMPLVEDLRVINKVSQNLHAELALREVARRQRGRGSFEASRAEMKAFLTELELGPDDFFLRDGSGLSRQNLVSPSAVVAVLRFMWRSPHRDDWLDTLPLAGMDGTLTRRFSSTVAAERIQAKTGTLTHVSALSGYLDGPGGHRLAFSILVNNYTSESAAARAFIDRICLALAGP